MNSTCLENLAKTGEIYSFATFIFGFVICVKVYSYLMKPPSHTKLPGPLQWPIIGNLSQLGSKPHITLTKMWKRYGDIFAIKMGSHPAIVFNGAKTIKHLLTSQGVLYSGRPDFYTFKAVGNGKTLTGTDGLTWHRQKQIVQRILIKYVHSGHYSKELEVVKEAGIMVNNLTKTTNKASPELEFKVTAASVMFQLLFGDRENVRIDKDFINLVTTVGEFEKIALSEVDLMPWTKIFSTNKIRRFKLLQKAMDDFVAKHEQYHAETYVCGKERDITDWLLREAMNNPETSSLTREHIMMISQDLLGPAIATVGVALTWFCVYMAEYPDVQNKLKTEIRSVLCGRLPECTDIELLPYVYACLLETLRFCVIIPLALPHATTKDSHIGNTFVAKNTLILLNLWSIRSDKSLFTDPECFDPTRFLTADGDVNKAMVSATSFPFSFGKRQCLGKEFSKIQLFLLITVLMQKCRIHKPEGEKYSFEGLFGIVHRPLNANVIISRED